MTILLTCLLIAVLLPILSKGPLAVAMARAGGYDNKLPRVQQQSLQGFGLRAKAAHENSFEALAMFAPGVLATIALDDISTTAIYMAVSFVIARVGYLFMYWLNLDILRSIFWFIGFGASIGLLIRLI